MSKKNIIKIILDIAMVILFITFFNKNLISFKFHIRSGCIFGVLILVHMFLNRKWIVNVSKRLFDKKIKLRMKISYIISMFLLVTIFSIIVSGVLMMKASTYDRLMFWKMLHFGSSYLSIALIGIHIGIYWNFVMNMFKKVFKIEASKKIGKLLCKLAIVLTLVFGMYTMYNSQYFVKLNNTISYVIEHIVPQDLEQPEGNGYQKEHIGFATLATTYGSIMSVFAIATYYADANLKKTNKIEKNNNKISQAS